MKKKIVFLLCILPSIVFAQGIPVFDGANVANGLNQLIQWDKQLIAMKQQYDMYTQQYKAITGARNFGDLLNNPALGQYLPSDMRTLYNSLKSPSLNSSAAGLRSANQIFNCGTLTGQASTDCNTSLTKNYADQDLFSKAYQNLQDQASRIQTLKGQVQQNPELKDSVDYQNALQAEQLQMQNNASQMQLAMKLAEIQTQIAAQQKQEQMLNNMTNNQGLNLNVKN